MRGLIPLLSLLIIVNTAYSWGPFTHQVLACQLSYPKHEEFTHVCPQSQTTWDVGASSPDAFKKIAPTMHSLEYAGVQLAYAMSQNSSVTFARGYGSHLIADEIGHKGYLNPQHDHELEFAVDTFDVKSSEHFSVQKFVDEDVSFVEKAAKYYASIYPTFKAPNLTALQDSVDSFEHLMTEESIAIAINVGYKAEMQLWDRYTPNCTWSVALGHYEASRACILNVYDIWQSDIDSGMDPVDTAGKIRQTVDAMIEKGECK